MFTLIVAVVSFVAGGVTVFLFTRRNPTTVAKVNTAVDAVTKTAGK